MKSLYFSHDANAHDDPKCMLLIDQMGLEGYGIFWILIEVLRIEPEMKYPITLLPILAKRYNTSSEKMVTVVTKYQLFEIENNEFFFSESLQKRILEKSEQSRKAVQSRWESNKRDIYERNTNVLQPYNERNTTDIPNKIKNNKEKKSKEDNINTVEISDEIPLKKKVFQKPSMDEICEYLIKHNSVPQNQAERLTEKFFNFYESKDWYVGKNKMKNWKAAATNSLTWKD